MTAQQMSMDNCVGTSECDTICANELGHRRTQVSSCIPVQGEAAKWQSITCQDGTATRTIYTDADCTAGSAQGTENIGDCTDTCPSNGVKPKGIVVIGLLVSMVMAFHML